MMIDPKRFGGLEAFRQEMDYFVAASLDGGERNPGQPVRMPGHRGLALKRQAIERGIALPSDVWQSLEQAVTEAGLDGFDIDHP